MTIASDGVVSDTSGKRYSSWHELVNAEANGWAIVVLLRRMKSGQVFARTIGPFDDKSLAIKRAVSTRRKFHKYAAESETELLGVHIEPLWEEL